MVKKLKTPYLLTVGELESPTQIFLVTDCKIITEVSLDKVIPTLLSAYFAYNICYSKGTVNVMSTLEIIFLKSSLDKAAPSVKQFLTNIEAH